MQDRLNHAPYRLRASHWRVLLGYPGIQRMKVRGLQADSYEGPLASRRGSPAFLCYHSLTFHGNRVNTEASRGEGFSLPPRL